MIQRYRNCLPGASKISKRRNKQNLQTKSFANLPDLTIRHRFGKRKCPQWCIKAASGISPSPRDGNEMREPVLTSVTCYQHHRCAMQRPPTVTYRLSLEETQIMRFVWEVIPRNEIPIFTFILKMQPNIHYRKFCTFGESIFPMSDTAPPNRT